MIRAIVVACLLACAIAAPAHAGVLAAGDAADLAQSLADAQDEQGVCYGWNVTNNFSSTPDVGSSDGGPGVALKSYGSRCKKGAVILSGVIQYACGSCDSSDSASISIISAGLRNPPTVGDLDGLGLQAADLTGDDDDTTLVNLVEALPLLVADRGNAPYVAYEQATTVPAADHETNEPGSDTMRDSWIWLVLSAALIVLALIFFLVMRRNANTEAPDSPPPNSPPPPPPAPAAATD